MGFAALNLSYDLTPARRSREPQASKQNPDDARNALWRHPGYR
jgi:hypothetical protein